MKIYGFYHVCMINHYEDIVDIQVGHMVKSGLYEECDCIHTGVVGEYERFIRISEKLSKHPKFKLSYQGNDLSVFEFKTLEMLYKKSIDEQFYGFYIHTKGCSYPNNEGGRCWLDYMNHFILNRWNDNLFMLSSGYDLCGVKLLDKSKPPVYRLHYSGNFFWFRSEYVYTLKNIFTVRQNDRYEAEMWIGSGSPKATSLCQRFVDYNTKGKFKPPKAYCHTLSFNIVSETEKRVNALYELNDKELFEHTIVDLSFPLEYGDKIPSNIQKAVDINSVRLKDLSDRYGSGYIKLNNVGVSQNWNAYISTLSLNDDDIVVGVDPDEDATSAGWVDAMLRVMSVNERVAVCSLYMPEYDSILTKDKYKEVYIGGIRCWFIHGSINWALIGISGRLLNRIKGIPVPEGAPIYGWLESELIKEMSKHGFKWVILPDYIVNHTECNAIYRKWKNECVYNVKAGQVDFTEWLKKTVDV